MSVSKGATRYSLCGIADVMCRVSDTNGRDRGTGEQREGHDRNFPKLDFCEQAMAAAFVGAQRAKADGETVDDAGGQDVGIEEEPSALPLVQRLLLRLIALRAGRAG